MHSFTGISPNLIILSGIKGIQHGQEDSIDNVVSNDRGFECETDIEWV